MPRIKKEASLDLETWKIAQEIENYSDWTRQCLHAYASGNDYVSEARLRMRWVAAARQLAALVIEYAATIDPDHGQTVETLIAKAMEQTRLEEFE
jgi:hypothetical protein